MDGNDNNNNNDGGGKKTVAACDFEALKKCLEEHKGDRVKCQAEIEAFKAACSLKKSIPSYSFSPRPRPANSKTSASLVTEL